MKLPLYDLYPQIDQCWIAPNATVVGEVFIHRYSTVWHNAVIRGDINRVEIKSFTSIGAGTVIHTAAALPTGLLAKVTIGRNTTIGSGCTLYSCTIGNDVVLGDKCVVLEGAIIEDGAQLAPGSVVPPGRLVPAKQLWGGNPVEYMKDLGVDELWANYSFSYVNTSLGDAYLNEFTGWPSNYLKWPSTKEDASPDASLQQSKGVIGIYFEGQAKYYA